MACIESNTAFIVAPAGWDVPCDLARAGAATARTSISLSADGKKMLYQAGPAWAVVGTEQPPKPGDGKLAVALPMRLDPRAEWRQIYKEAWRIERDFLYVDNLQGADWDGVFKRYEPWVESVGHRADLTYILDVLGGELSLAHTFTGGGDEPSAADSVKIGQLGADLTPEGGRYRITRLYTGENWNPDLRAPLSAPGVKAAVGNYLLAINGAELRLPTDPFSLLEGTAEKQTVLRLNDRPTLEGSWTVTVVPVADEGGLRTRCPIRRVTGTPTSTATTSPSRTAKAR